MGFLQDKTSWSRALTACLQSFEALENALLVSQPPDRRERLQVALQKLMVNVMPNLESKNREVFTSNVQAFRSEIRQFILI